jgi:hypothetical protein
VAAMPGVQDDRLDIAQICDSVRPHKWLNGFGQVSARHQKFSILFNHGKAQPTSSTIDDGFPAAADEFQRVISCVCLYFLSGRHDFCGQAVKLGNVFHAQIIVPVYFDYLPFTLSNCH